MPRLWTDTIEAHRQAVRDATLDTTAELVVKHGLRAVTMSQIAEKTGVGRATLYKYFRSVEEILFAWHERMVAAHLAQLAELRDGTGSAQERLETVLLAYAHIQHEHADHALARLLHRGEHLARAELQLKRLLRDLLAEAATSGSVRDDVACEELASYCVAATAAAAHLPSKAAVRRLIAVILAGLSSPR